VGSHWREALGPQILSNGSGTCWTTLRQLEKMAKSKPNNSKVPQAIPRTPIGVDQWDPIGGRHRALRAHQTALRPTERPSGNLGQAFDKPLAFGRGSRATFTSPTML
jgi:hypothetical protein